MKTKTVTQLVDSCFTDVYTPHSKICFLPRHPALRRMEGAKFLATSTPNTYLLPARFCDFCSCIGKTPKDVLDNPYVNGMRVGKLLAKLGFTEAEISKCLQQESRQIELTLTCRFKDFLRMSKTSHYGSCFNGMYKQEVFNFLANPYFALLIARDNKGDFHTRVVVRLMFDQQNRYALEHFDIYTAYPGTYAITADNIIIRKESAISGLKRLFTKNLPKDQTPSTYYGQ